MEVLVTVYAKIMDGQTIEDIKGADILACENAKVIGAEPFVPVAKTKYYLKSRIIKEMCKAFGVSEYEMKRKGRKRERVYLRHAIAYLLTRTGRFNSTEIAKAIGLTNHSSALHSIDTAKDLILSVDSTFLPYWEQIKKTEKIINISN